MGAGSSGGRGSGESRLGLRGCLLDLDLGTLGGKRYIGGIGEERCCGVWRLGNGGYLRGRAVTDREASVYTHSLILGRPSMVR